MLCLVYVMYLPWKVSTSWASATTGVFFCSSAAMFANDIAVTVADARLWPKAEIKSKDVTGWI